MTTSTETKKIGIDKPDKLFIALLSDSLKTRGNN